LEFSHEYYEKSPNNPCFGLNLQQSFITLFPNLQGSPFLDRTLQIFSQIMLPQYGFQHYLSIFATTFFLRIVIFTDIILLIEYKVNKQKLIQEKEWIM